MMANHLTHDKEKPEICSQFTEEKNAPIQQNTGTTRMSRRGQHENALVLAAAVLFRKQGYAATGTIAILKRSGAPRGSLYHYFPDGKEAIGAAALEAASKVAARTLRDLGESSHSPAEFVRAYAAQLGTWMAKSGFTDGCPAATTILETVPASAIITPVAQKSFQIWLDIIAHMLARHGWPEAASKQPQA